MVVVEVKKVKRLSSMERAMAELAPLHDIIHEYNVRSRTNNKAICMRHALGFTGRE